MILQAFSTPAFINDFPNNPYLYSALANWWSLNVNGWIQQATPAPPSFFYNPLDTDVPAGTAAVPVTWVAFPGRLDQYYSSSPPVAPPNPNKLSQDQVYSLADTGYTDASKSQSFQDIPAVLCPNADWSGTLKTFGPYGPRGWLDEYCEWSAARDANNNLIRIDFCCENPEYWTTLWKVDQHRVRELYEETLNFGVPPERKVKVALEDLQLIGQDGNPVIDPQTQKAAYNPLNKWNSGPVAIRTGAQSGFTGGAMHLTSTPNTLQTELGLAGASSVQFTSGNNDPQALICCGQFGQEYRHSDPHIGQSVNQVVSAGYLVCLADPVGLYIQLPQSPQAFTFGSKIVPGTTVPTDAQPIDIWQIVRGSKTLTDPATNAPFQGNFVLHVACQIPSSWLEMTPTLTLADILISGAPITWTGQVANQFHIGLFARPVTATSKPPVLPCAGGSTPGAPQQCMFAALWEGYYPVNEPCPTGTKMSLASNTTFIAPWLPANGVTQTLALTCNPFTGTPTVQALLPDNSGPDPNITIKATVQPGQVTYAVPGNSYPSSYTLLYLDVTVGTQEPAGLRTIQVTVDGQSGAGGSLPAAFFVLAS